MKNVFYLSALVLKIKYKKNVKIKHKNNVEDKKKTDTLSKVFNRRAAQRCPFPSVRFCFAENSATHLNGARPTIRPSHQVEPCSTLTPYQRY
jgi:hypothetical protein